MTDAAATVLESDLESLVASRFAEVGWDVRVARGETFGDTSTLGRGSTRDAILFPALLAAIERLNPALPEAARNEAWREITKDRSSMMLAAANREIYGLLRDGIKVETPSETRPHEKATHIVRVIDWDEPANNRFVLVRQLTVSGSTREFRPDLIGFVNGLPLLFVELKRTDKRAKDAFDKNLAEYKKHIPQLFWANAIVLATNGVDSRVGTITSEWEHFKRWGRVESEREPRDTSLDTTLRALFAPKRMLDVCENFILFEQHPEGLRKVLAQNHQLIGVNLAVERVRALAALRTAGAAIDSETLERARRLGVFWHTQGSGKSYSMVFFARKVLRKIHGAWTFVVITDRLDLDEQISKTFIRTGTAEDTARAASARELREMLSPSDSDASTARTERVVQKNARFVFTLIQRFRNDAERDPATGERPPFPALTTRDNIIVIADEAHRSQYAELARNVRVGLPCSARIGFTGTPLLEGDETTVDVFGDYVSKYRFFQAVEDGATVPLYYESRVTEMHYDKETLEQAIGALEDEEALSDAQRDALSERFGTMAEVVTRTSRLVRIANDLVEHFLSVDPSLKAMVVGLDKPTVVRLYHYFKQAWDEQLAKLRDSLAAMQPWDTSRPYIEASIARMERLDSAVVLSRSQADVEYILRKCPIDQAPLDAAWIKSTLERAQTEDLAERFKTPTDPLRLVFVCSMWITGFDAPSVGVVYLDRPMRNHSLMQTIARANRVHGEKEFGLIVDYVGVLDDLDTAFRDFAGRSFEAVDRPIEDKSKVVARLEFEMTALRGLLDERDVSLEKITIGTSEQRAAALNRATEQLVFPEVVRARFLAATRVIVRLHRAIGLDARSAKFDAAVRTLQQIRGAIRAATEDEREIADRVLARVGPILDRAITAEPQPLPLDIARINLVDRARALASTIDDRADESSETRVDTELLTVTATQAASEAARRDPALVPLEAKLEDLVRRYNEGALSPKGFADAVDAEVLREIDARDVVAREEGLTRAELVAFDIVMERHGDTLGRERDLVKDRVRDLSAALANAMGIDWQSSEQGRSRVRVAIERALGALPSTIDDASVEALASEVYRFVIERGWDA